MLGCSYDLPLQGIIKRLQLLDMAYNKASTYGHFDKAGLPWGERKEKRDRCGLLNSLSNIQDIVEVWERRILILSCKLSGMHGGGPSDMTDIAFNVGDSLCNNLHKIFPNLVIFVLIDNDLFIVYVVLLVD